jgi:hypothetical protein
MRKIGWGSLALSVGCCALPMVAQSAVSSDNAALLQRALRESVLIDGRRPFHLIVDIAPAITDIPHHREVSPSLRGSMEVFWSAPDRYKLILDSPGFQETKIIEGTQVEEHEEGDFYPRWLDNFVQALLNPVPQGQIAKLMSQRLTGGGTFAIPGRAVFTMPRCLETSDRPGGITDETSIARICFDPEHPWYQGTLDFTRYVSFKDFAKFDGQIIPRTWSDDIPENLFVDGKVRTLETLSKADADKIRVSVATPISAQLRTVLLERKDIEEHIERLPNFEWPAEDTETLEGYMIVYVRTDRTGQVRESYWDSSDNYKLQDAGVEFALKTKLKPLLVDGAAVQMEGPLVIHFKTHRSGQPSASAP